MAVIRPGTGSDLARIEEIYDAIHTAEEAGKVSIGWVRGVYPTRATAQAALDAGYMDEKTDVHTACMDICTIIKGCVFEWCLVNGDMDIRESVYRIIGNYLRPYLR